MGAISIAFDTIIAGALALPWLLLVVHLFFPNGEQHVSDLPKWIKEINQPAAVAVLLFALTYLIGSAVSRTAQDFSNDDDLHVSAADFHWHGDDDGDSQIHVAAANGNPAAAAQATAAHLIGRLGSTETRIRASVYCDKKNLLPPKRVTAALAAKLQDFAARSSACDKTGSWIVFLDKDAKDQETKFNGDAEDVFGMQESALLLQSEDSTLRLRQLHDQVMVLRSASFNGLIAGLLCFFAWGARLRHERPRSVLRWLVAVVPALILLFAFITLRHHYAERSLADPPYMEYSMFLLAGGGVWLVWLRPIRSCDETAEQRAPCRQWLAFSVLSMLLMLTAALAWWSSEVAYTEQVIYSYDSLPEQK